MSAGQGELTIDLETGRELRFLDRLLDRFDGRLQVDDHAAPHLARVGEADPDDVEPVVVGHLADDSRDFLDVLIVEADQISLPFTHHASELAAARGGRPDVHPLVEAQVDVIDLGHARPQCRRQFQYVCSRSAKRSSPT